MARAASVIWLSPCARFLAHFDSARFVQQRRSIDHLAGNFAEGIEENLRRRRRFAYHAIGRLRAHIEFNTDLSRQAVFFQDTDCRIKRPVLRRPGIPSRRIL